jgi:hypothetical protein
MFPVKSSDDLSRELVFAVCSNTVEDIGGKLDFGLQNACTAVVASHQRRTIEITKQQRCGRQAGDPDPAIMACPRDGKLNPAGLSGNPKAVA